MTTKPADKGGRDQADKRRSTARCNPEWMRAAYDYTTAPRARDLAPFERALLIALAAFGGDDNREVWPSIPTLARMTGYSERTVQAHLPVLEAMGAITIKRSVGGARPHVYTLHLPGAPCAPVQDVHPSIPRTGAAKRPTGAGIVETGAGRAPETRETRETRSATRPRAPYGRGRAAQDEAVKAKADADHDLLRAKYYGCLDREAEVMTAAAAECLEEWRALGWEGIQVRLAEMAEAAKEATA